MKNSITVLGLLLISGTSFSQTGKESNVRPVSTASNGVIISESAGVEGFVVTKETPKTTTRIPVSEWSLETCDNALYYLEQKIANPEITEEERVSYRKQRTEIQLRKQQLQNTGK